MKENKLWFRRKRWGWGWTPVTWQGWASIILYVILVIRISVIIPSRSMYSVSPIIILTALLIALCYWKGEAPKWQWGKRE